MIDVSIINTTDDAGNNILDHYRMTEGILNNEDLLYLAYVGGKDLVDQNENNVFWCATQEGNEYVVDEIIKHFPDLAEAKSGRNNVMKQKSTLRGVTDMNTQGHDPNDTLPAEYQTVHSVSPTPKAIDVDIEMMTPNPLL